MGGMGRTWAVSVFHAGGLTTDGRRPGQLEGGGFSAWGVIFQVRWDWPEVEICCTGELLPVI